MGNRTAVLLAVGACLLHGWAWWSAPRFPAPRFLSRPSGARLAATPPFMRREFIAPAIGAGIVHAASLCELVDGTLAAAWYAGSNEAAPDVTIQFATRPAGDDASWTAPRVVVSPESASRDLGRFVKSLGNPVMFADSHDRLWLVYVSVPIGGWAASSLNATSSTDGGRSWSPSRRLTLSPFFNISELARNRPVALEGGGFAIPIYQELFGTVPEILWWSPGAGEQHPRWMKTRMASGPVFLQPAVVPLDPLRGVAFYRSRARTRRVGMAESTDAGATWSVPRELELPNPGAAIAGLALSRGRILIAFNDSVVGRDNLRLAVSDDRGVSWTRVATIEEAPDGSFSYPDLVRARDGSIHLVYTWRRKRIAHAVLNEAWLNARLREVIP